MLYKRGNAHKLLNIAENNMLVLTNDEIRLLKELDEKGEQSISHSNNRNGLNRLVSNKFVIETVARNNPSITFYNITDAGRAAIHAAIILLGQHDCENAR